MQPNNFNNRPALKQAITIPEWLQVSAGTRLEIARLLGMVRTGATEVAGNTVISDGYTHKDLETITQALC